VTSQSISAPDEPHVLVLVENMSVPADRRVWLEARALAASGFQVSVVSPLGRGRDLEPSVVRDGVTVRRFQAHEATGGALSYAREYGSALVHMRRLALRIAREHPIDVVHLCNPPDVLYLAAKPLIRRGARVVFDQHDLVPELYEARFGGRGLLHRAAALCERRTYAAADVVIAPNESYRRIAIARGGKSPDDVFVVRIAPELELFTPVASDPAIRRGAPCLLAYVGTIGPQDGVDHALRALEALGRRRADWRAVFAGRGDWRDDAIALASELGLGERVSFPGYLEDAQVVSLLSSADICIAPEPANALNDASTMIKVVEYMALGKPIVAYDLRETRVSAGESALYATPNRPDELATCIVRLLDDKSLRLRLGAEGRRRVEDELAWRHSEEALRRAYDRVLGCR
jgi:glycosyltransferase involved in cell wall biosynthesis